MSKLFKQGYIVHHKERGVGTVVGYGLGKNLAVDFGGTVHICAPQVLTYVDKPPRTLVPPVMVEPWEEATAKRLATLIPPAARPAIVVVPPPAPLPKPFRIPPPPPSNLQQG